MGKFSEGLFNEEKIFAELNILNGQSILDAGCGDGYMAKKFSKLVGKSGKVYAIDPDRSSISTLKKEIGANSNITASIGDITKKTALEDSSLDIIYLSTVFHIFSSEQVQSFDKEVKRILKHNGKLAIVNINKEETPFGPPLEMRSSPEELTNMLSLRPTSLVPVAEHFYMQVFMND